MVNYSRLASELIGVDRGRCNLHTDVLVSILSGQVRGTFGSSELRRPFFRLQSLTRLFCFLHLLHLLWRIDTDRIQLL